MRIMIRERENGIRNIGRGIRDEERCCGKREDEE